MGGYCGKGHCSISELELILLLEGAQYINNNNSNHHHILSAYYLPRNVLSACTCITVLLQHYTI